MLFKYGEWNFVLVGDQVYLDFEKKNFLRRLVSHSDAENYLIAVESFRNVYRRIWSHRDVAPSLRRGENWMLPDDHDLLNNLGADLWSNRTLRPFLRAGRQVFYEYQYQLQADMPISVEALRQCASSGGIDDAACVDADAGVRISRCMIRGNVGVAMLDVRLHRSFLTHHQLLDATSMIDFELCMRDLVKKKSKAKQSKILIYYFDLKKTLSFCFLKKDVE